MNSTLPSSEVREIAGHKLTWHRWHPTDKPLKAAIFFLHGQGDYGERYQEIADFLLKQGIAFATCDLPGHGTSSGKRGHVPSLEIVETIATQGLIEARALVPNKPVGLGGHSVGGLLALYLLGELKEEPDFSWISSPLLKPEDGKPAWKNKLIRPLSSLFPSFTISTGVTADMCRQYLPGESETTHLLFHNRISLSWAHALIKLAEVVRTQPERLTSEKPLLITQGGKDPICPAEFCQELVSRIQRDNLQLFIYPKARHEPFADEGREEVFANLGDWLSKTI